MARRCTTVPGYGTCCRAAQQGLLGQNMRIATQHGERCARCDTIQRTKGKGPGFRFRFVKNSVCGIGPGGCPALAQAGAGNTGFQQPGQVLTLTP